MIQIKTLKQRWFIRILFAITIIPLLLLNIRKDQDWGDDNSQYIHQAKNIVEGIPQFETGYIYNNHYPILGPSAYTIGFPLILSPVYEIFGNNILAFNYYLSLLVCLIVLLFILWTTQILAPWKSLLLILIFVYNPWLLRFKSEINSEIPFTLILLWVFYLFEKQKNSKSISLSISLLMGLLISIRPIGFVVPLSLFILMVYKSFYKKDATKKQLLHLGIFTPLLSFFVFFLLNYLMFPLDSGVHLENQIRTQLFSFDLSMAYQHLILYYDVLSLFIQTNANSSFSLIGTIGVKIFMITFLIGLILKIRKSFDLADLVWITYLIVLLFYNYANAGFRFLMPIAPILFLYAGLGFNKLATLIPYRRLMIPVIIGSAFLLIKPEWENIHYKETVLQEGPMIYDAQFMFGFIKSNTTHEDRILFNKPRALSLYTSRSGFANLPNESQTNFKEQLIKYNIHYLLQYSELYNPALDEFLSTNTKNVTLVQTKGGLNLYKIINYK